MSRQTEFTEKGVEAMARDFTPRDLKIMKAWKSISGQCPWCMYTSDLWDFATFVKKRKGRTVSDANCQCPECGITVRRKTLISVYNMDMTSYGKWFWDQVFSGAHDKVSWEPLKRRLNGWFNHEDRQPFWDQYWAHKELSLGGWESDDDDEAYEDYRENYPEEPQ